MEVPAGARLLFTNGQVGARLDGSIPNSTEEQVEVIFERLGEILIASNMTFHNVIKFTVYVADKAIVEDYLQVAPRNLDGHTPAATLLVVNKFPREGIEVEIEAIAAKVD